LDQEPRVAEANLVHSCAPVKIGCFSRVEETGAMSKLHIGYPLRFYHYESESFLQASANKGKAKHSPSQKHLPYLKRVADGDYQNIENFSSKASWLVENIQRHKGGLIQWDLKVRLRHVPSGLYLAISYVPEPGASSKKKQQFAPVLVSEQDLPALKMDKCQLVFSFQQTCNDVDNKVVFADDALLLHTKLEGAEERCLYLQWTRESKGDDERKGSTVMFGETFSTLDAFQMVEIDAPQIPVLLNMVAFRDIADQYVAKLGKSAEPLKANDLTEEHGMLTELLRSIVEGDHSNEAAEEIEGPSDEFQQTMARHLKLINSIFSMIQAPLENMIILEDTAPLDKRFLAIRNIHSLSFVC